MPQTTSKPLSVGARRKVTSDVSLFSVRHPWRLLLSYFLISYASKLAAQRMKGKQVKQLALFLVALKGFEDRLRGQPLVDEQR